MRRLILFFLSLALIYFGVNLATEHIANGASAVLGGVDFTFAIGALLIAAGLYNFLNVID